MVFVLKKEMKKIKLPRKGKKKYIKDFSKYCYQDAVSINKYTYNETKQKRHTKFPKNFFDSNNFWFCSFY